MPKRPDSQGWRYARTVLGVLAAATVLIVGGLTGHVRRASADNVDCSQVKCVALTFDDGPSPFTDRLLQIRRNRLLSIREERESAYVEEEAVREEIVRARRLFERHKWPVIDVTRRSVEETAAAVINLLSAREGHVAEIIA